jgi:hypothetical protein
MDVKANSRDAVWLIPLVACVVLVSIELSAGAQGALSVNGPDLSGSYDRYRGAPGVRGASRQDPNVPPPAAPPPLKPQYLKEWQAKQQAAREADAKGEPLAAAVVQCLPEGMPGMMNGPFPMEILQSKGQVTIIQEAYNQVRRIVLDQPQKPIDDVEPGFYGHSVGHWEGDTLVVDTVGIKESVRYQNTTHSKEMRIKERIRSVAPDIVWDEITIDDPVTLEKPWAYTLAYKRMPGYTLLEYICEDNREYADDRGLQKVRIGTAK